MKGAFFIAAVLIAFVSIKISNIYVPENFDNPSSFRFTAVFSQLFSYIVTYLFNKLLQVKIKEINNFIGTSWRVSKH